jgi:hypothetical protein
MKIEGYWNSRYLKDKGYDYPKPIPNILTEDQANIIHNLILEKQKKANKVLYRGMSHSRIENGLMLGNAEYQTDAWKWPGDFAEHYVLKHKVKPSNEFLEYIGYKGD